MSSYQLQVVANVDDRITEHCKWDKTITSIHHPGFALNLTFHGFDPLLFASDNSSMIRSVPTLLVIHLTFN